MAVLGRVLIGSAERLDRADMLSIDSFTSADFKYMLQSFVGSTTPYVLKGCEINNPGDAIGTESVAITVADSVIYHPTAGAGPFFYGLEEGNEYAADLVPELRKNATNFVYLTFDTFDTAQDSRAFWDPDQDGGEGSEFSQDVNTESVLTVDVGVSVATFPEGTIPIAKVIMDASVITSIQDCRNMLFRLGTGGIAPNPFSDYDFRELPGSSYSRLEPSTTMNSSVSPNCFQGGDKNITSWKEWMDVVMTKLKELSGTTYWYESASGSGGSTSTTSLSTSFLKSKGKWLHSDSTPGQVQFTEDIQSVNLIDPRSIIFRASTKSLSNNQVLYADLIDGADINLAGDFVDWVNGGYFVSATGAGKFANLSKGDWIKKKTDTDDKWVRVEEFYAGTGGGGSIGTPTSAQSVLLNEPYQGTATSIGAAAEYTKGVFSSSDLSIASRGDAALQNLSGSFFWLAARTDTIQTISNITANTLTIDSISGADGERARCTVAGGHDLEDGYYITIKSGTSAYGSTASPATYKVEVEDSTHFYINTSATGDENTVTSYWGMATFTARESDDDNGSDKSYTGIELESESHNFENDSTLIVSGTTNFNGSYTISCPPSGVADYTKKVQFAIESDPADETTGLATMPRVQVRDEFGITKIVQGESVDIGSGDSDTILDYIGMPGQASESPDYYTSSLSTSYNAKDGFSNYNTDPTDNLTVRAAKLTAMMADRIQDRGMIFRGISTITNTGGSSISATSTLNLIIPGSSAFTVDLTTAGITPNSTVVIDIDRDSGGPISTSVVDFDTALIDENRIVLFYRFSGDTSIYTWDGYKIPSGETHTVNERVRPREYTEQDRTAKLIKGGTWSWDATVGSGTLTWSDDAYVQIPGIADASNTISAGSQASISDGNVLSVELERETGTNTLSITNSAVASATLTEDTYVIARRVGDDILIGESFLLKSGEYLELDGALAEINRYHGQLKIENGSVDDQVVISVPDISLLDGETLSQELNGFLLDIASDIVIDFNSGTVSGGATGTAFTPGVDGGGSSLVSGDYLWYGIGLLPNTLDALNKMSTTVQVTPAATKNSVEASAPYPVIVGTKKIGLVQVYHDGSDIEVTKIIRFGTGAGGGSGTGNADSYTETLKNQLINSWYEFVTPNIFSTDEDSQVDGSSTGGYSAATTTFDIGVDETMISIQSYDADFLADPKVLSDYQLSVFWNSDGIDTTSDAAESFDITVVTYGSIANTDYIKFFAVDDVKQYCLWFNVSGSDTAPTVSGTDEYIEVAINGLASNDDVASAIESAITGMTDADDFSVSRSSNVITVLSNYNGYTTDASYTTGAEVTVDNFTQGRATYMISRDGGNEYQPVSMERVGSSTDTYTGSIRFREEKFTQTLHEESNTADGSVELSATSSQQLAQSFTLSSAEIIKEASIDVDITGSPVGYLWVSLRTDDTPLPSTEAGSVICESDVVDISTLSDGTLTVDLPHTALAAGTYHLVIRTDATYKAAYVASTTSVAVDTYGSGSGSSRYDGSDWFGISNTSLKYAIKGSTADLRVKITSGAADKMLAGYGVFYDMRMTGSTSNTKQRQVFAFNSSTNPNEFTLTDFTPDPDLLEIYLVETGQVFKHGAFYLDGHKIVFPTDTFLMPSQDLTLIAMQQPGGCVDNSDINALLLAANSLGSTDPSIDRSSPGRGIFLRKPNGELREIAIDDNDNIVIYSV